LNRLSGRCHIFTERKIMATATVSLPALLLPSLPKDYQGPKVFGEISGLIEFFHLLVGSTSKKKIEAAGKYFEDFWRKWKGLDVEEEKGNAEDLSKVDFSSADPVGTRRKI
jgi:hypothetical protein